MERVIPIESEFFLIHSDLEREAPGGEASTRRALASLPPLEGEPWILDVGCGPGSSTQILLRELRGRLFALDCHRPYLDSLHQSALDEGSAHRLTVVDGDMASMPFPEASFDLIWSEGAIYVIGFERGLRLWRPLLKEGAVLAVTDAVYLAEDPSEEVRDFWGGAYPTMATVDENLQRAQRAGYDLIDHFVLPHEDWCRYYLPLEERLDSLGREYEGEEAMEAAIAAERREIELWRRHGDEVGYAFFVLRRRLSTTSS